MPSKPTRTREQDVARKRAQTSQGRDIGPPPPPNDPERRAACERDFKLFCETYFPMLFTRAWSEDHLLVIARIEQVVLDGGQFALAMPRGSGKTTLAEVAALWATLYGHRRFTLVSGSDQKHADMMIESIKSEMENNRLLEEDFPEAIYPVLMLEGIKQRAHGQMSEGVPTRMKWGSGEIAMPCIEGSKCSGSVVQGVGITGGVRGIKARLPTGEAIRPELILVDDPQTDESARSTSQCEGRERTLKGAIMGTEGTEKIALLMPCTVIAPNDLAERILDRDRNPEFQGERTKMLYGEPDDPDLWEEYDQIRIEGLKAGEGLAPATKFYEDNREAMDAGLRAAWEARYNHDELSAIQHAMNKKLRDPESFAAEYQNEPLDPMDEVELNAEVILGSMNGLDRGVVPQRAHRVVTFIDVQKGVLFWKACAFEDDFTGYIIDYGAFPDQKTPYFTLANLRRTYGGLHKGLTWEAALFRSLADLSSSLLERIWEREDGAELHAELCIIDANWSKSTDIVYDAIRASPHAARLYPSHGKGYGATTKPMAEEKGIRGDRTGDNWRIGLARGKRAIRHIVYDTNHWKSFLASRFMAGPGSRGSMTVFGVPGKDEDTHRLLVDHLVSERPHRVESKGRVVDEWKTALPGAENHWLDGGVGCCVAASILGCKLGELPAKAGRREKLKLSEIQKKRKAA